LRETRSGQASANMIPVLAVCLPFKTSCFYGSKRKSERDPINNSTLKKALSGTENTKASPEMHEW